MELSNDGKEKRRRLEGQLVRGESFSEPDLTTAGAGRPRNGRHLAGYPPGFTVDELRWYRKKPPGDWGPKDNLTTEDGSMTKFKSEYKRCFRHFKFLPTSSEELIGSHEDLAEKRTQIRPSDYFKLEGDFDYHPEYKDLYIEYPLEKEKRVKGPLGQLQVEGFFNNSEKQEKYVAYQNDSSPQLAKRSTFQGDEEFTVNSSEMHSQFIRHTSKKADLTRRPTSLQLEGDMAVSSETSDQFVEFLKETRRPDLIKGSNNLKLEGEIESQTESQGQYIQFELPKRVPLTKQVTNLQLEGTMDTQTEAQDKYVPYNVQERPPLVKRQTNLHLEGDMDVLSEKQDKFVPHNAEKRPAIIKRDTNLHLEGEIQSQSEKQDKYIPFELSSRQKIQKRPTNLHLDGEMNTKSEKSDKYVPLEIQKRAPLAKKDTNLQLKGDMVLTPEYRKEFIYHQIDRVKPNLPINNLGVHIDDTIVTSRKKDNFFEHYQKPFRPMESTIHHEIKPSHKENYIPHKMEKVLSKRPKENLKPEGSIDLNTETKTKHPEKSGKEAEVKKRTREAGNLKSEAEYKSSYVDFPRERAIVKRPEGCLKTEGNVSHLSEKSSAYISHGPVTRPPLARREDSLKMDDGTVAAPGDGQPQLGGRFECQPEYRKAYNDYLQRENINRKSRKVLEEAEGSEAGSLSKIPLPKGKRQGSKSPTLKPPSAVKSRSVSPRRRPVPRTPHQQRVLVPDMGEFTPRRPSSIFGPKTGRWYPRAVSPGGAQPGPGAPGQPTGMMYGPQRHSDEEWECGSYRRGCEDCTGCHRCHSRSVSRWESPCGHREYHCDHPSPRYHSPSPPRRQWTPSHPTHSSHHTTHPSHQSHHSHTPHSILRTDEKPASFVVLTDKVEINNNRLQGGAPIDGGGGGGGGGCKEQKWMPPWYEPPM